MEIKGCKKRNTKDSNMITSDKTTEYIIIELISTLILLLLKSVRGYMGCKKTVKLLLQCAWIFGMEIKGCKKEFKR